MGEGRERDEAFVTLATNDTYALGCLVLGNSLRRVGTSRQLVVMVTQGVSSSMRDQLAGIFNQTVPVNVLDSSDTCNLELLGRPDLSVTFTKFHCWRLTQFKKCVFLDADTLVVQNIDELFDREELSAAPDAGWPDCFNSGVFVYVPSQETYRNLLAFAVTSGSFDGGDQGLLNLYFHDWATKDIGKHLPFIYNVVSQAFYSYLPAFKQFYDNIKVVHFIGAVKPWHHAYSTSTRTVTPLPNTGHSQQFLQFWWNIFMDSVQPNLDPQLSVHVRLEHRPPSPLPPPPPPPHSTHGMPSHPDPYHDHHADHHPSGDHHGHTDIRAAPTTSYHVLYPYTPPALEGTTQESPGHASDEDSRESKVVDVPVVYREYMSLETHYTEEPLSSVNPELPPTEHYSASVELTGPQFRQPEKDQNIDSGAQQGTNSPKSLQQDKSISSHNESSSTHHDKDQGQLSPGDSHKDNTESGAETGAQNGAQTDALSGAQTDAQSGAVDGKLVNGGARVEDKDENENSTKGGIVGDLANINLTGGDGDPMKDDRERKLQWEQGQADYMGVDRFDNIKARLDEKIAPPTPSGTKIASETEGGETSKVSSRVEVPQGQESPSPTGSSEVISPPPVAETGSVSSSDPPASAESAASSEVVTLPPSGETISLSSGSVVEPAPSAAPPDVVSLPPSGGTISLPPSGGTVSLPTAELPSAGMTVGETVTLSASQPITAPESVDLSSSTKGSEGESVATGQTVVLENVTSTAVQPVKSAPFPVQPESDTPSSSPAVTIQSSQEVQETVTVSTPVQAVSSAPPPPPTESKPSEPIAPPEQAKPVEVTPTPAAPPPEPVVPTPKQPKPVEVTPTPAAPPPEPVVPTPKQAKPVEVTPTPAAPPPEPVVLTPKQAKPVEVTPTPAAPEPVVPTPEQAKPVEVTPTPAAPPPEPVVPTPEQAKPVEVTPTPAAPPPEPVVPTPEQAKPVEVTPTPAAPPAEPVVPTPEQAKPMEVTLTPAAPPPQPVAPTPAEPPKPVEKPPPPTTKPVSPSPPQAAKPPSPQPPAPKPSPVSPPPATEKASVPAATPKPSMTSPAPKPSPASPATATEKPSLSTATPKASAPAPKPSPVSPAPTTTKPSTTPTPSQAAAASKEPKHRPAPFSFKEQESKPAATTTPSPKPAAAPAGKPAASPTSPGEKAPPTVSPKPMSPTGVTPKPSLVAGQAARFEKPGPAGPKPRGALSALAARFESPGAAKSQAPGWASKTPTSPSKAPTSPFKAPTSPQSPGAPTSPSKPAGSSSSREEMFSRFGVRLPPPKK